MAFRPYMKHTHVYKTHLTTDLHLDVYLSTSNEGSNTPKPVLLWFHGGYLVTGSRIAIPRWLLNHALAHGWTVVSPDYRVLPECTGLATTEDLISAYEWVAGSLNRLHPDCNEDLSNIIIGGASAGGWCALVTALHFSFASSQQRNRIPRPKALWLLYPMSDIGSEKWAQSVSLPGVTVDAATAQQLLEEIPRRIAQGNISVGEDFPSSEEELRTRKRLPLLYAILGKGVFLDYLTGVSGFGERSLSVGLENAVDDERMKILFPLQWGLFGSGFPATIIVHGSADTEVSCGESEKLAAKLQENGIGVQYYAVPGADHVFDLELQECHEEGEEHEPSVILARALQALQGYVER
ncbi:uncharacterized protein N7484_002298 [Penicillium longicatenatum]|uniref:uncharacterized protein n=1 Tax=Penicillium longicatenatum TaxID=1561947 RepID=UPI0025481DEC|nr:uncharacterized protein N7484_002298 [Penicillium longicatenatum]KAJ5658649.1 hypothetical protein N7484_002298 [Penicillium longicatenatum]